MPSYGTISEYNSVGDNSPDGVLHDFLKILRKNFEGDEDEWHRYVSLKWDACHVLERIVFNSHTKRIIGFTHDAFDEKVLLKDLGMLKDDEMKDDIEQVEPPHAKQYLIFMISNWEKLF